MPKLKLFDLIQGSTNSPVCLGMTLNKFAMVCKGPKAWTFPWDSTFPGSFEYGDLLIALDLDEDIVRIVGVRIKLWDTAFPEEGDAHLAPIRKPTFSREISVDLQEFRSGQSIHEVQRVLEARAIRHRLFIEKPLTEDGNYIVANENTLFNFGRGDGMPWLMSIEIFHELHPSMPIANGLGAD